MDGDPVGDSPYPIYFSAPVVPKEGAAAAAAPGAAPADAATGAAPLPPPVLSSAGIAVVTADALRAVQMGGDPAAAAAAAAAAAPAPTLQPVEPAAPASLVSPHPCFTPHPMLLPRDGHVVGCGGLAGSATRRRFRCGRRAGMLALRLPAQQGRRGGSMRAAPPLLWHPQGPLLCSVSAG